MLLVDLPLCFGATGSLAAFYALAKRAQGRPISEALMRLPVLIALGTGLGPHLTRAVFDGLRHDGGRVRAHPEARACARAATCSGGRPCRSSSSCSRS